MVGLSLKAISIAWSSVKANFSCAVAANVQSARAAIIIGLKPNLHIFLIVINLLNV
jgi:hypothetical protein